MISGELAGGDCLNAGCVPSKALLRCAKLIREAKKVAKFDNEYGVSFRPKRMSDDDDAGNSSEETRLSPMDEVEVDVEVDFPRIMQRMRKLRSKIAPVDGHERGSSLGTQTFQGRGVFTSPTDQRGFAGDQARDRFGGGGEEYTLVSHAGGDRHGLRFAVH